MKIFFISLFSWFLPATIQAREIALTFDDAPVSSSRLFQSQVRTRTLIQKLKALSVPPVLIFANPCNGKRLTRGQLETYVEAGHFVGNHTCGHLRLDEVGYDAFAKDALRSDNLLRGLFGEQRFFRFPYLGEGTDLTVRDQVRSWLKEHGYRNGYVSVDTDDYLFSGMIKTAMTQGKRIDHRELEKLFVHHILGAADFFDHLAVKTIGRSPKHVLLLHEMDATVLYLDALVRGLRRNGWKIISATEAYKDPVYAEAPKNNYANNGLIAQLAFEKTNRREAYGQTEVLKGKLAEILGLKQD